MATSIYTYIPGFQIKVQILAFYADVCRALRVSIIYFTGVCRHERSDALIGVTCMNMYLILIESVGNGRSVVTIWKYQFSYNH